MVPHGMLGGAGMGRTDTLPISVPSGAYVVPADIVSGIGQGNSHAGGAILARAFGSGPLGMPVMHGHSGFGGPHNIRMGVAKLPLGSSVGSVLTKQKGFQQGGPVGLDPTSGPYLDNPTNQSTAKLNVYLVVFVVTHIPVLLLICARAVAQRFVKRRHSGSSGRWLHSAAF
jgi:hypothetical protein